MIKHVFFDVDDTLFPSSEFAELARKNAVNAMIEQGTDYSADEISECLEEVISAKGSNYPAHFDMVCQRLKIKNAARYVAAAIYAYHNTKTAILPYPEVKRVLLLMREKGYVLHVATNGNAVKQWDKLIRLGISLYFDNVFVSEEMGEEKGVSFFKRVLGILKTTAKNCVMVGDREENDIVPARECGMHTVRVLRGKYGNELSTAEVVVKDFRKLQEIINKL